MKKLNTAVPKHLDILVIIALFMFLFTHFATVAIINKKVEVSGAEYAAVVELTEANPIAKWWLLSKKFGIILSVLIVPALVFGYYWFIRKRMKPDELKFYVYVVFFIALSNVVNDAGVL